ncbi:MAG: hypothetical protein V4496_01525 [Pseudomonadota bacterium]
MSQIKSVFRCENQYKLKFSQSSCLLTISVGQETHEKERFSPTIDLIGRSFSACTIALHDSLQRHTIALDREGSADDYYDTAIAMGDLWLERNKQYLDAQNIPVTIIRWDEWFKDVEFQKYKEKVINELNCDESYRAEFNRTISEYLTRCCKRHPNPEQFDRKRAEQLCLDYLIEECAVLCMWPKTGCQFEAYTGKHNAAMNETQKRFLTSETIQSIAIGFNRRPNLKPQNFNFHKNEESVQKASSVE